MMAAWEKQGLINEVFNMCETTVEYVYVDDNRVGVDRNAPSRDLPKPPSTKGREDARTAKGKGKGRSWKHNNQDDWNASNWQGNNWRGHDSAHSSSLN